MGANIADAEWVGAVDVDMAPKIELCPADRGTKVIWIGNPPFFGVRSYAMNSVGTVQGQDYQVYDNFRTYPLPDLSKNNRHGVGIYWDDGGGPPDFEAKGYPTSVVKDYAGTILLAEEATGQQAVGNQWPCICNGPLIADGGANGNLYQIDTRAGPQDPNAMQGVNQGQALYRAHRNRFNYLFHDNHVEALRYEDTVGGGTPTQPRGMWTVTPGD
jgi:prepilin-type processing-associated H-X9-DG protein